MDRRTFDVVIVGAGSAGCVLARRLTDASEASVLLLEAGLPDNAKEVHIPAAFAKLFRTPRDWAYETEPQPELAGRRLFWPRGKMLGGSSSMNAMIYIRGHRTDFDGWSDAGCAGWGYADVLPYFKRAENHEHGASEFHGVGGPLNVADLRDASLTSRAFVDAAVEHGLARNPDFNGAEQDGVGLYQVTQRNGRRCSTAAGYLKPALGRTHLTVETGALATRIILDGSRAAGVEYVRNGRVMRADATREVILCGGAINSPQLLMLSGVGPADELARAGITAVVDLPGVGQNLQDHLLVPLAFACKEPVSLANAESFGSLARYLLFRRGPLTSNVAEAGGFVRTSDRLAAPDLQFHFGPAYYLDHGFTRPDGHGMTLCPTAIRPASRGYLTITSSDPAVAPRIEPRYFSESGDIEPLVEGVRLALEIFHAPSLARYRGAPYFGELRTRAQIEEHVRRTADTIYHPTGTCMMGTGDRAVVDPELRVRGIERLRVADASVMPTIVAGNTNAAAIMIGERAADLVLAGT